jgi:hypothetical protein
MQTAIRGYLSRDRQTCKNIAFDALSFRLSLPLLGACHLLYQLPYGFFQFR